MKDKRASKTEKNIIKAFIELSKNKDVSKITVTELCKKADINRCTFYDHYEDFPKFLDIVEIEIATTLISIFKEYHYDTDGNQMLIDYFDFLYENKDCFFYLYNSSLNGKGLNLVISAIKEITLPIWLKETDLSANQAELIFAYAINGAFSLAKEWCDSNFQIEKSQAKELLENVAKYGVYNYIYTK